MGLMDFFKRRKNKTPMLEAGKMNEQQKEEEGEEGEKVDVQIFSRKREDSSIEYSVVLNVGGNSILAGKAYSTPEDDLSKKQHVNLKNIANIIKDSIQPIADAKNRYSINRAKQEARQRIQSMANIEGVVLTDEIMQYIEQYRNPMVNQFNQEDKKKQMDAKDASRLQELESIKTPEDADEHKDSLIAYMQRTEKVPINPIVEANIKSLQEGKQLDDNTMTAIAQNMKELGEELGNEDGLLYSVYLKIEEKRIWRQVQTRLAQYSNDSGDEKVIGEIYKLSGVIDELDKYELPNMGEGHSQGVLKYMIDEVRQTDIKDYIQNAKEKDTLLARSINTKFAGIQDKTNMLQFLYARIGSLGQLSYKSALQGNNVLRNFVANTDFKHEDNTETKQFLLTVANIEKENIQNKYKTNSFENNKTEEKPFKERLSVQQQPVINLSDRQETAHTPEQDGERIA